MRYRQLGSSDLRVSEICLGSWLTYGGAVERDRAEACVAQAFDSGINFIDTANVYAAGAAEEFLGEVLSSRPRDSYVLATKLFWPAPDGGSGLSREQVFTQLDASLARLRTDYVDLYQCHRYDFDTPLEETLEALTEVVRQGKARHIGFSEWPADRIQAAVDLAGSVAGEAPDTRPEDRASTPPRAGVERFVSSQPSYSLIWRGPETEVIPVCKANGISQIVFSPLGQGILTGKYKPGEPAPEGSRATDPRQNAFMDRARDQVLLERVQQLGALADEIGCTTGQLSLAWILREPNVASAIVGATRPEQVIENAGASGIELDAETIARMEEIVGDRALYEPPMS